jgi:D-3-phosphoglycerate dehydrogenase
MRFRVLVTCTPMLMSLADCQERFKIEHLDVVAPKVDQHLNEEELSRIIADFDGMITGDDPLTARVLEAGRKGRLRVIVKWGIGLDAIDLEAAKRLGIYVANTPGMFSDEVADVALGYLLLLARGLHKIDAAVHQGHWLKIQGTSLRGKVGGIIGVGNIGSALVRRFHALGMSVLGYDLSRIDAALCQEIGLQQVTLEHLFDSADCIVLCCSLTSANYHLINAQALAKMKDGVWIVNVARGALIDENALIAALETGKVGGAALDVFESEPIVPTHPLLKYERVIVGSHNASNTREAVLRVNQLAIDILVRELRHLLPHAP